MELTNKEYWKENWQNLKLPARFGSSFSRQVIATKIVSTINKQDICVKSMIEIGGCPGRWADLFNQKFGCKCDVIEYEENSAKITEKNLKLLKIKGKVYNQDVFKNSAPKNSYDIVSSYGLVEHFDKLNPILEKHIQLAKPGGILIISVPNLGKKTFYSKHKDLTESFKIQREITVKELRKEAKKSGLKILYLGYLGVFNYGLLGPDKRKDSLFSKLKTAYYYLIEKTLGIFSIKKESKFYSPYIFLIAKKPDEKLGH